MVNVGVAVPRLAPPSTKRSGVGAAVPPPTTRSPNRPVSTTPSKTKHSAAKAASVTMSPSYKGQNIRISIAAAPEHPMSPSSPRRRGEPPPSSPSRPIGARTRPKPIGTKRTPSEARLTRLQASSLKTVSPEQQRQVSITSPRSLAVGDEQHRSECSRSPSKQRCSSFTGNSSSTGNALNSNKASIGKQPSFRDLASRNQLNEGNNKQEPFPNAMESFAEPNEKEEKDYSWEVIDTKPKDGPSKQQHFDGFGWGTPSRTTAIGIRPTDQEISFPKMEYVGDPFTTTLDSDPFEAHVNNPKKEKEPIEITNSPRKKSGSSPRRTRRASNPRGRDSSSNKTKNFLPILDLCGRDEHDEGLVVTALTERKPRSNGSCNSKEGINSPFKLPTALDSPKKESRKRGEKQTRRQRRASMGDPSVTVHTAGNHRERRPSLNMMQYAMHQSLDLSAFCTIHNRSARSSRRPSLGYMQKTGSISSDGTAESRKKSRRPSLQHMQRSTSDEPTHHPIRRRATMQHITQQQPSSCGTDLLSQTASPIQKSSKARRRASLTNLHPCA